MSRVTTLVVALLVAGLVGGLLPLAARALPPPPATTFVVNATSDRGDQQPGDGSCFTGVRIDDGVGLLPECTLRAAIEEANLTTAADTIAFAILSQDSGCDPTTKVCTIRPASPLPFIYQPVTIDGYTQPGARPNTAAVGTNARLRIEVDGTNAANNHVGLEIRVSDTVVRGLVINRFDAGIIVFGATVDDVHIAGCFLGTDPSGTAARPNAFGLVVLAPFTLVGGADPAARNLIAGNTGVGVDLGSENAAYRSRVQGNLIGTDRTGAAPLPNGDGVRVLSYITLVGGDSAAEANVVAFNRGDGVVVLNPGLGNRILGNSIFANRGEGIDLGLDGPMPNDPGDDDAGPNYLQNTPRLTAATRSGTTTTVTGRLNSTPDRTFVIQFFANPAGGDEGKTFLGQLSVTTNATGNASYVFRPEQKVAVGQAVTATATDPTRLSFDGNTSEFSAPRLVAAA